jgi:hypothetical protein
MLTFHRSFLFAGALVFTGATALQAAATNAAPAAMAAAPAFVEVVTFETHFDGDNHKILVTSSPTLVRVDEASDGYSVIYDPQTQHYTGLEHKNYTYWNFSWPEVRAAVETSKRAESRIQELGSLGLDSDNPSSSTAPGTSSSASGGDDSGYVWRPTTDKKRIADFDCVRWTGDTVSGEKVEAWCYAAPLPQVQAAVEKLHAMNAPMALVPVRTLVPDIIFSVFAALRKGGVTPIVITWGDDSERNRFAFVEQKTRDGKLSLFTVPKLYVKTTLVTMDGMIDSQPVNPPRKDETPHKTWQNQ